ncbi:MAG: hypothetical protein LBC61_05230 [Candidatus Peribacteria bacterium]|nr:hypothetical protein [Candidatus Peribacteria bacterium]
MLQIVLQIIFQTAISISFFIAETIQVTNSGKEVQAAIIVNQIIVSLIQKDFAILEACSTTKSEPIPKAIIHKVINKLDFQ